ncbi:MAG: hypothetical protein HQ553_19030 [Chloroflexi bacterium]|nr:hypothetical protein [Chloroflexota bacterium]
MRYKIQILCIGLLLIWTVTQAACDNDRASPSSDTSDPTHDSETAEPSLPLKVHPDNPRYFSDSSGDIVYLTGSHTWANLVDIAPDDPPTVFDFIEYLDFLKDRNHNFIRLWTWELTKFSYNDKIRYSAPHPWLRTGPGNALDELPKFDLSQFDTEYFSRLRERVEAADERGIYVSIMLFEGHAVKHSDYPWKWQGHPFNTENNMNGIDGNPDNSYTGDEIYTISDSVYDVTRLQESYVRKIIDTVNDFDNVLFEIGNEVVPASTQWQYHMIEYVKNYEASKPFQHPVGMTFQIQGGNNATLFDSPADWISPNSIADMVDYFGNPPAADGSKVIIIDTDHLCGIGCGPNAYRWVWKSFLRGYNPIYMDPWGDMDHFELHDAGDEAIRDNMGYTLTYANKMNLVDMIPRPELSTTGYCLANPGSEYLFYQPVSGAFTVTLDSGDYYYEWFNPDTGKIVESGDYAAPTGDNSFLPPFGGHAVLYLKSLEGFKPVVAM